MSEIELAYERNFDTLLLDSLMLLERSLDFHSVEEEGHTLSRASIIFSLLLLEASANSCIEHLRLEKSIHREIDRLPVLGKYDFYLRCMFRSKHLGRGVKEVEWVRELKSIRDGLVHPKPQRVEWKYSSEKDVAISQAVRSKVLNVAVNPNFWDADEAVKVAAAVHGFLRYFYVEKCNYSAVKVASILFSESKKPGDENFIRPCISTKLRKLLLHNGIDISYLKLA